MGAIWGDLRPSSPLQECLSLNCSKIHPSSVDFLKNCPSEIVHQITLSPLFIIILSIELEFSDHKNNT